MYLLLIMQFIKINQTILIKRIKVLFIDGRSKPCWQIMCVTYMIMIGNPVSGGILFFGLIDITFVNFYVDYCTFVWENSYVRNLEYRRAVMQGLLTKQLAHKEKIVSSSSKRCKEKKICLFYAKRCSYWKSKYPLTNICNTTWKIWICIIKVMS